MDLNETDIRIIRAAILYFEDGYTQQDIASLFNVSVMTVSRWISRARELGIVKITIHEPFLRVPELEDKLRGEFGLRKVVVAQVAPQQDPMDAVSRIGAYHFQTHLKPGDVIGVGGSATVSALARKLGNLEIQNVIVTQLMGGLGENVGDANPITTTQLISETMGIPGTYLYLPAIVESVALLEQLLSDSRLYKRVSELWSRCTHALIGVGGINDDASLVKMGYISQQELQKVRSRGAVGDILGNFFDKYGQRVIGEFQDRAISISLDDLCKVPNVVAIALGAEKVNSLRGVLKSGVINWLVTDDSTARQVLSEEEAISC